MPPTVLNIKHKHRVCNDEERTKRWNERKTECVNEIKIETKIQFFRQIIFFFVVVEEKKAPKHAPPRTVSFTVIDYFSRTNSTIVNIYIDDDNEFASNGYMLSAMLEWPQHALPIISIVITALMLAFNQRFNARHGIIHEWPSI